jgi:hypothetical protein
MFAHPRVSLIIRCVVFSMFLGALPSWAAVVNFVWDPPVQPVPPITINNYIMERRLGPASSTAVWTELGRVPGTQLFFSDTQTIALTEYCWRVRAFAVVGGAGAPSNSVCLRVPAPASPPPAPLNLRATIVQ